MISAIKRIEYLCADNPGVKKIFLEGYFFLLMEDNFIEANYIHYQMNYITN